MTNEELREACGIPEGCPYEVLVALVRGDIHRETREGIARVQAAAREQASWSVDRKEEARLLSLRRQLRTA